MNIFGFGKRPDYNQYMQSEAWDKKRKKRLSLDDYICQDCRCKNKPLDVHHLNYKRLGRERMEDLLSVCRSCHLRRHKKGILYFGVCRTCGEFTAIVRKWLPDYWTRWTCDNGHIVEKRGWHE